jgi:hypothetical protein
LKMRRRWASGCRTPSWPAWMSFHAILNRGLVREGHINSGQRETEFFLHQARSLAN